MIALALTAALTAICLLFAAIAEHRRKDLIVEMMDEAERCVRHGDACPWDLK